MATDQSGAGGRGHDGQPRRILQQPAGILIATRSGEDPEGLPLLPARIRHHMGQIGRKMPKKGPFAANSRDANDREIIPAAAIAPKASKEGLVWAYLSITETSKVM